MDDDVVRQAPLFAALDDEAAEALRSTMTRVEVAARRRRSSTRATPATGSTSSSRARSSSGARSGDGRENLLAILGPGRDVRRAVAVRPRPAHRHRDRGRRHRRSSGSATTTSTPWLRGRPEVARHLLRALARRLRRTNEALADLVFSDVPGPRRQGAARPAGAVRRADRRRAARRARPDPGGARAARRRLPRDREQGARRLRRRGWLRLEARAVVLLDLDRLRTPRPLTRQPARRGTPAGRAR